MALTLLNLLLQSWETFHVQFCQEAGPGEFWSPLLDLESREDIFYVLSRQHETAHKIITTDFKFYFHSVSYAKESLSETKYLYYYPVKKEVAHESDCQLVIINWASHIPELVCENRQRQFAVLKYFQLEAADHLPMLQFQNHPVKRTLNACFTQTHQSKLQPPLQQTACRSPTLSTDTSRANRTTHETMQILLYMNSDKLPRKNQRISWNITNFQIHTYPPNRYGTVRNNLKFWCRTDCWRFLPSLLSKHSKQLLLCPEKFKTHRS